MPVLLETRFLGIFPEGKPKIIPAVDDKLHPNSWDILSRTGFEFAQVWDDGTPANAVRVETNQTVRRQYIGRDGIFQSETIEGPAINKRRRDLSSGILHRRRYIYK